MIMGVLMYAILVWMMYINPMYTLLSPLRVYASAINTIPLQSHLSKQKMCNYCTKFSRLNMDSGDLTHHLKKFLLVNRADNQSK